MLERAVRSFFEVTLTTRAASPLPKRAYYRPRARYRAEKILTSLRSLGAPATSRILAVTAVDISTTKPPHPDWGILGLATVGGPACVVSTFRCRRKVSDPLVGVERFGKLAVHELGHTFGLQHCTLSASCLMTDGGGSARTLDSAYDLCRHCRGKLLSRGVTLTPPSAAPWREPG